MDEALTTKDISCQLYDVEGEPVEVDDVQRINLGCFKCEKPIEDNFAMLIGHMKERSSDYVSERTTVELCETCYHAVMRFCGSTED